MFLVDGDEHHFVGAGDFGQFFAVDLFAVLGVCRQLFYLVDAHVVGQLVLKGQVAHAAHLAVAAVAVAVGAIEAVSIAAVQAAVAAAGTAKTSHAHAAETTHAAAHHWIEAEPHPRCIEVLNGHGNGDDIGRAQLEDFDVVVLAQHQVFAVLVLGHQSVGHPGRHRPSDTIGR